MAKTLEQKPDAPVTAAPAASTPTDGATAPAKAVANDDRFRKITTGADNSWVAGSAPPTKIAPNTTMNRKDFIMSRVNEGASRGQITKEIKKLTNDPNFKYQIVFQATKDLDKEKFPTLRGGHPAKAETAAPAAAAATTSAPAATS